MNQELNTLDRLALSLVKHKMDLEACNKELLNKNLTDGEIRAVHAEIAQLEFCIRTLNFIKND